MLGCPSLKLWLTPRNNSGMDFRSEDLSSQGEGCQKPEYTRLVSTQCVVMLGGYVQQVIETGFDFIGSSSSREGEDLFGFVVGVLIIPKRPTLGKKASPKCHGPKRSQADMSYIQTT